MFGFVRVISLSTIMVVGLFASGVRGLLLVVGVLGEG
jgi:hypothetical protein